MNQNLPDQRKFKFKEKIKQFFANTLKENLVLVCNPNDYLLKCGLPNKTIAITKRTLQTKVNQHNLTKNNIKDINTKIKSPVLVYHSEVIKGAFNIIIEETNKEGLICISLHTNSKINKLEINEIASIHGRKITQLIKWIEDGYLIDSNINKIKKIANCSQFNSAQSDYLLSLLDKAKLNNNSDNTKNNLGEFSEKNFNLKEYIISVLSEYHFQNKKDFRIVKYYKSSPYHEHRGVKNIQECWVESEKTFGFRVKIDMFDLEDFDLNSLKAKDFIISVVMSINIQNHLRNKLNKTLSILIQHNKQKVKQLKQSF